MAEPPSRLRRRDWLRLAAVGLAAPALRGEELRRLPPPDNAGPDPALNTLIARIRQSAEARDTRSLEAMMLPDFRVEFDAGKGPAAFRRHWRSEQRSSALWTVLPRLLELPGSFYAPTLFALPFVFTHFPTDLDPIAFVVATAQNVPLYAKPETGAERIGALDFAIIPLVTPLRPPVIISRDQFLEVIHPEAGHGFVSGSDVYSPAGHRMFFEKRKGQWRWISLAAATLADPPELKRSPRRTPKP